MGTTKASAIGKGAWRASHLRSSTTRSSGTRSSRLSNSVNEIRLINRLCPLTGFGTIRRDPDGCEIDRVRCKNRRLLDRPVGNSGYVRVAMAIAGVNQSNRNSWECMVRSSVEVRLSTCGDPGSHGAARSVLHDSSVPFKFCEGIVGAENEAGVRDRMIQRRIYAQGACKLQRDRGGEAKESELQVLVAWKRDAPGS
jgi:hypothetical protein